MAMFSSSSSSSSSSSTTSLRVQMGVLAALLLCSLVPSASAVYFDDAPPGNLIIQWSKAATSEHVFLHLAQLKVLKGIKDGRSDANPTAAAAYVSHFVLRTFHWENQVAYDFLLQTQLRPLNLTKEEKIKARRYAIKVALPIIRGRITSSDYLYYPIREPAPPNGPVGVYQFAPGQVYMVYSDNGIQPFFAKDTRSYIRAIRPPPVPSPTYNAALKEVREIGGLNGSTRTKEQDEILLFHAYGISTTILPSIWHLIARKVLPSSISLYDAAYVLTEIGAAVADGSRIIAAAKAEYFFWRPITAIRQGDSENKPVKDWRPTAPTFEDPEFPSGTAFVTKGGVLALKNYFGTENVTFNLTIPFAGQNITRTYRSFSQYAEEMALWRILCGNHYRFSVNAGAMIADLVSKTVSEKMKQQFK